MYIINTFLGFIIAQLYDILTRSKNSSSSPERFDVFFFIKDTWVKMLISLVLSLSIALAIHLNWANATDLLSGDIAINDLIYLAVGAVPELILQRIKKKTSSFLQPDSVRGFNRKK